MKDIINCNAAIFLGIFLIYSPILSSADMAKNRDNDSYHKKDEIMRRDQIDNTDVFAIPLDSSEIEDEEQINRAEGRNVFAIPPGKPDR